MQQSQKIVKNILYCASIITRDHPVIIVTPNHGSDCLIMSLYKFQSPHLDLYFLKVLRIQIWDHEYDQNYIPEESFQN